MIDYAKVLAVINASDDPPHALALFVMQEREAAIWASGKEPT